MSWWGNGHLRLAAELHRNDTKFSLSCQRAGLRIEHTSSDGEEKLLSGTLTHVNAAICGAVVSVVVIWWLWELVAGGGGSEQVDRTALLAGVLAVICGLTALVVHMRELLFNLLKVLDVGD